MLGLPETYAFKGVVAVLYLPYWLSGIGVLYVETP